MFIAYVKQKGEGCDYTIACGETLWRLKATTLKDAIEELKNRIMGKIDLDKGLHEEGYWDECELDVVTLFEVSNETFIPLNQWYKEGRDQIKKIKAKEKEKIEKMEFERLKRKYG